MNNLFTIDGSIAKRVAYTMLAALLVVAGLPILQPKTQAAQLSSRSIQLSDSANSGTSITTGVGSGVNVTYRFTFTTGPATAESMVIDFCTENPIVSDTCTRPTMDNSPVPTIANVTGQVTTAGWTVSSTVDGEIRLAKGGAGSAMAASTLQRFDLVGITNPTTVGTFYARMYTYANDSFGTYTSPTAVGTFVDYGGVALSTTRVITITARVQEQLTFCVTATPHANWLASGGGVANECSASEVAANPPAITLGHGSPTATLDASVTDTASIYSQLSTNATSGAVINLRSNRAACATVAGPPASLPGGLSADGGANCFIPPHNSGSGAAASSTITAGTAAFGLFVAASTQGPSGIGSLTPASDYHDSAHTTIPTDLWYGMDTTTAPSNGNGPVDQVGNVISTFGDTIAATGSPTYRVNSQYVFAATASLTTPAGIYTANLSMIATGTF